MAPEDVARVVFTHHFGWSTDGPAPLLARDEHRCQMLDWDSRCGPDPVAETAPGREDFGA